MLLLNIKLQSLVKKKIFNLICYLCFYSELTIQYIPGVSNVFQMHVFKFVQIISPV